MVGGDNELITQDCGGCERVEVAPYDSSDHRAIAWAVGASVCVNEMLIHRHPCRERERRTPPIWIALMLNLWVDKAVNKESLAKNLCQRCFPFWTSPGIAEIVLHAASEGIAPGKLPRLRQPRLLSIRNRRWWFTNPLSLSAKSDVCRRWTRCLWSDLIKVIQLKLLNLSWLRCTKITQDFERARETAPQVVAYLLI